MKRNWLLVLVLFTLSTPTLWGQTQITGSGTANTVPQFTDTFVIGNSPISISGSNVGIGITSPLFPLHIYSNNSVPPAGQDRPTALLVESAASPAASGPVVGIESVAGAQQGFVIGVHGVNASPEGIGVLGNGGPGTGVHGQTDATIFAAGVGGMANALTGPAVGVFGQAHSPDGDGGLFANFGGGNILRGLTGSGENAIAVFRVDRNGTVFAEGGFRPHGADFAESMPVSGSRDRYRPGDLMVIDPAGNQRLALSNKPYSTLVAGIYSTSPGVVGSHHPIDKSALDSEVPLAIVGIVPCNVTAENGPIAIGDLLVASSAPGRAMKGTDRTRMLGAVVGKALESLQSGNGVIQVLVTLQ